MNEENVGSVTTFYKGQDVKVVWLEDGKSKLGRGRIVNDDHQFIYLKGQKGSLVLNKEELVVIKGQSEGKMVPVNQRSEEENNEDNASK